MLKWLIDLFRKKPIVITGANIVPEIWLDETKQVKRESKRIYRSIQRQS